MKNFILFLVCLFILSSQFYFFDSGLPQPSFLILAAVIIIHGIFFQSIITDESNKKAAQYLFLFFFYSLIVNLLHGILNSNFDFLISSVYIFFNLMVTIVLSYHLKRVSLKFVKFSIFISLGSLVILYQLGFGEYKFGSRYNGFFNDPNQMAYWCLCLVCSVGLINDKGQFTETALALVLVLYLVNATQSRSAFLGLIPIILIILYNATFLYKLIGLIGAIYLSTLYLDFEEIWRSASEFEYITRLLDTDFVYQARGRGFNKLFDNSNYLFFGAGQGYDQRFLDFYGSISEKEIHSTWLALLFYYGVVGLLLFLQFLRYTFRNLSFVQSAFLVAPLLYGITTYGIRTPIFWFMISIAWSCASRYKINNVLRTNTSGSYNGYPRHI